MKSSVRKIVAIGLLSSMLVGTLGAVAVYADDVSLAQTDEMGNAIGEGGSLTVNQGYVLNTQSQSSGDPTDITASYSFVVASDIMGSFTKNDSLSTVNATVYDAQVSPMVRWNKPFEPQNDGSFIVNVPAANINLSVYTEGMQREALKSEYLKSNGEPDFDKLVAAGLAVKNSDGSYSVSSDCYGPTSDALTDVYIVDGNHNATHKTLSNAYTIQYAMQDLANVSNSILSAARTGNAVLGYTYDGITSDGEISAIQKWQSSDYFANHPFSLRVTPLKEGHYAGQLHLIFDPEYQ